MDIWVADSEADDLLDKVTKMHCFVMSELCSGIYEVYVEKDIDKLKKKLSSISVLVGHNFFGYDLPMLNHLYGVEYPHDRDWETMSYKHTN